MSHFTINSKERTTTHIVQQIHAVPYTYISFRTYCKASLFKQNYVTFVISIATTSSHGTLVLDVKQIKPLHFCSGLNYLCPVVLMHFPLWSVHQGWNLTSLTYVGILAMKSRRSRWIPSHFYFDISLSDWLLKAQFIFIYYLSRLDKKRSRHLVVYNWIFLCKNCSGYNAPLWLHFVCNGAVRYAEMHLTECAT